MSNLSEFEKLLKPIGFKKNENLLFGPEGIVIENCNDKYFIKKYPRDDYSGKPITWGKDLGLEYDEALLIIKQLFLLIEW